MKVKKISYNARQFIFFIVLLALSVVLLFLRDLEFIKASKSAGLGITMYFVDGLHTVQSWIEAKISANVQFSELNQQYHQLLSRMDNESISYQDIDALIEENKLLRETLNYSQSLKLDHIPAEIVGKDPEQLFFNLLINKGNRHGIESDMSVIAYQDNRIALVGKISEVSWNSAIIRPIIDPNSYISGRLTRTRFEGLLHGRGNLDTGQGTSLLMEYLSRNSRNQISVGDEIITSGLDSIFPPDILIGTVIGVSTSAYSASLELEIAPFIDFGQLEQVFVLNRN